MKTIWKIVKNVATLIISMTNVTPTKKWIVQTELSSCLMSAIPVQGLIKKFVCSLDFILYYLILFTMPHDAYPHPASLEETHIVGRNADDGWLCNVNILIQAIVGYVASRGHRSLLVDVTWILRFHSSRNMHRLKVDHWVSDYSAVSLRL